MQNKLPRFQTPERELLIVYPRVFRWIGWAMIMISIAILAFQFTMTNDENFSLIFLIQALIACVAGIWLSQTRIILTTQRISFTQPFVINEIERKFVQDIKIIPDQRTQQLLNQPKWMQAFSRKALHKDDEHWRKHGCLWFQHDQKAFSLNRMNLRVFPLHILSDEQRHDLVQHLQTHWGFAVNQVERVAVTPVVGDFNEKDIGKRCLYVLFGSIFIMISMSFAPLIFHTGFHFAVESYMALVPCILAAIGVSYLYIRAEQKAYPTIAALVSGTILGAALYFSGLQINRWYSEQHHQEHVTTLFLERYDQELQAWKLPPDLAQKLDIEHLYFSPKMDGYDPSLKAQAHYTMLIKQGLFNDYFVDLASMQSIQPVKTVE